MHKKKMEICTKVVNRIFIAIVMQALNVTLTKNYDRIRENFDDVGISLLSRSETVQNTHLLS